MNRWQLIKPFYLIKSYPIRAHVSQTNCIRKLRRSKSSHSGRAVICSQHTALTADWRRPVAPGRAQPKNDPRHKSGDYHRQKTSTVELYRLAGAGDGRTGQTLIQAQMSAQMLDVHVQTSSSHPQWFAWQESSILNKHLLFSYFDSSKLDSSNFSLRQ